MKNDGGSAFPKIVDEPGEDLRQEGGMSLRDYFAGMALQGLLSNGLSAKIRNKYVDKGDDELYAWSAYDLADAMLKERER